MKPRELALLAAAGGFAAAAVVHAVHAARGEGVVPRHVVFVGINLVLGALLYLRPRVAIWPIAALSLQQIPSHGADLLRSLSADARARGGDVDWASVFVLLFLPAVLTLLVVERRASRPARPPGGPAPP